MWGICFVLKVTSFSLPSTQKIDGVTCWHRAFVWRQHWAPRVDPMAQTPWPGKPELSFILNWHSQIQFISLHFLGRSLHRGLRWTCPLWGRRSWWQWRESWRPRTRIRRFGRWFSSLEFAERNDSESVSMLHQLTVRLYQHSSKYGTTEAAKTMVNTLKGKT